MKCKIGVKTKLKNKVFPLLQIQIFCRAGQLKDMVVKYNNFAD
jgi:hypothetical protein